MHELAVTQSLLNLVLERATEAHAARVTGIYVEIGELSSYVDDSVSFYWDTISSGTIAESAQLHFERIPIELECTRCATRFSPDGKSFDCPHCGSHEVGVVQGDAFRTVALDIEKSTPEHVVEDLK